MARTFQAYGCEHAMLLDMNSQEHTYMALYEQDGRPCAPHHLAAAWRRSTRARATARRYPRFVGLPDNRDFIYLLRK